MSETDVTTLDYQDPAKAVRPMSRTAAAWVLGLSAVPTIIGLAILIGFRLTAANELPMLGFFWLGGGGALTFVIGVIAVVNVIRAVGRLPKDKIVVRLYGGAIGGCVAAALAAAACVKLGTYWEAMARPILSASNATATPIDNLVIHFSAGDVNVGPIPPHGTVRYGRVWTYHYGPLEITTTAGGASRRKVDQSACHLSNRLDRVIFSVTVEDAELPRRGRP